MTKLPSPTESETWLHLLEELTRELQRAMVAVETGALVDLEQSVVRQQISCDQLRKLQRSSSWQLQGAAMTTPADVDPALAERIQEASSALSGAMRRHAMLVKHFGGTARLFAGMFRSYGGFRPAGTHLPQAQSAWSCEL